MTNLSFADYDDVIIIANNEKEQTTPIIYLYQQAKYVELEISFSKTKYMVIQSTNQEHKKSTNISGLKKSIPKTI